MTVIAGAAALAAFTAMDLGSKEWAVERLSAANSGATSAVCEPNAHDEIPYQRIPTTPVTVVANHFELRYAENCGAAFDALNHAPRSVRTGVFGFAAITASIVLCWMFVMGRGGDLFAAAVPLIVSGAIGNFYDRVHRGYVVDFIRWFAGEWSWPTFNIADVAIFIGVALLFIDNAKRDAAAAKGPAKNAAT